MILMMIAVGEGRESAASLSPNAIMQKVTEKPRDEVPRPSDKWRNEPANPQIEHE